MREVASPAAPRTRGELVVAWLAGCIDADQFMTQTNSRHYGGFNLVLGDLHSGHWTWLSNRVRGGAVPAADHTQAQGWWYQALKPGIYGVSNAALDTPWPKTVALKQALGQALESADEASLDTQLWAALSSRQQAPDGELPDTGLPVPLEKALSSALIDEPQRGPSGYGTRCSTLLVACADDQRTPDHWAVRMIEKTHGAVGMGHAAVHCGFEVYKPAMLA